MSGITQLAKIQLGLETVAGTLVDATTIWRGTGFVHDDLEKMFPNEHVGYLTAVQRSVITKYLAGIVLEETPATYEQLPYILTLGLDALDTGVQDGGGGYVYTYDLPETAQPTLDSATIEGGDNQQEEEFGYGQVTGWTLAGKGTETLNMSADLIGRQTEPGTFTAALSIPAVEDIPFLKGKLYIDPAGSMGSSLKSSTFLEMALNGNTGLVPRFTADGQLYFAYSKVVKPEYSLDITFEHDATAVAEKAAWRAGTARDIRMIWEGSAIAGGTTYDYKTLIVDLAGEWESFDKLDEEDGNDIVKGTFKVGYNATSGLAGQIIVVNELVSLP